MRQVQYPLDAVTGNGRVDCSEDLKRGWMEDIDLII